MGFTSCVIGYVKAHISILGDVSRELTCCLIQYLGSSSRHQRSLSAEWRTRWPLLVDGVGQFRSILCRLPLHSDLSLPTGEFKILEGDTSGPEYSTDKLQVVLSLAELASSAPTAGGQYREI
jgi:hypothetical protein